MEKLIQEIKELCAARDREAIILARMEGTPGRYRQAIVGFRSVSHNNGAEQFIPAEQFGLKDVCDMMLDMATRRQKHKVELLEEKISAMAKAAGIEVAA